MSEEAEQEERTRRSPPYGGSERAWAFWRYFARGAWRLWFELVHRYRWVGGDPSPDEGACLVASNHASYYDPVVASLGLHLWIRWMAWDALFRVPVLGWLIRWSGAFPTTFSGHYRGSYRVGLAHLEAGRPIGIFPEGERTTTGELLEPNLGAFRLAVRTGSPVIPVCIVGAHRVWPVGQLLPRPGRIVVRAFPAVEPPEAETRREAADELAERVMEPIRRRLAAGRRALDEIERRYAAPAAGLRPLEIACAAVPALALAAGGPPLLLGLALLPILYAIHDRWVVQGACAKHVRDLVPLVAVAGGLAAGAAPSLDTGAVAAAGLVMALGALGFRRRGARAFRRFVPWLAGAGMGLPLTRLAGPVPELDPLWGVVPACAAIAGWHLVHRRFRWWAYVGAMLLIAGLIVPGTVAG